MKIQILISLLFIVLLRAGTYQDEIQRKQRSINILNPDAVPLAHNNLFSFIVYVEFEQGKSLILPEIIYDQMVKMKNDSLINQWNDLIFNGKEVKYSIDTSVRDGSGIAVSPDTINFDAEQLFDSWRKGETGPILIQSGYYVPTNPNNQIAMLMGCVLEGRGISMSNPIKNQAYVEKRNVEPFLIFLYNYIDDINELGKNSFWPQIGEKSYGIHECIPCAKVIYKLLMQYRELFVRKLPTLKRPHSITDTEFPRRALASYQAYAQSPCLAHLSDEERASLDIDTDFADGLRRDSGGEVPETGEYIVSFKTEAIQFEATGLYQLPNSVVGYEVLTEDAGDVGIYVNHLSDSVIGHQNIFRIPLVTNSVFAKPKKGKIYSLTGGPIQVLPDKLVPWKIKFTNVVESPGFDIRRPETITEFANGKFNNTALRWGELICDSIWFNVELDKFLAFSEKEIKDFCNLYDMLVKGMLSFSGNQFDHREHFVIDIKPRYGDAHAGNPIVASYNWQQGILDKPALYQKGLKNSYWGVLHEIGHNMQRGVWTFPGFFEVTNNVIVLYTTMTLLNNTQPGSLHNVGSMTDNYVKYLLGQDGMGKVWGNLHLYYYLALDFGWYLIGNVFNRYNSDVSNERSIERWVKYTTEDTGMNMVPAFFFFRYDNLFKNINETYDLYKDLPVYEPQGDYFEKASARWDETKTYFGFTESLKASKKVEGTFNVDRDQGTLKDPSPLVEKV